MTLVSLKVSPVLEVVIQALCLEESKDSSDLVATWVSIVRQLLEPENLNNKIGIKFVFKFPDQDQDLFFWVHFFLQHV